MSLGKDCLCHSANSRTARCCLCCSCFVFSTFLHFSEVHVVTCYIQNTLFLFCTFEFLVSYLDAKCDGYCKYRLGLITLSPGSRNFRCSTGWDYPYTCKWNSQPKLIPLLWLGNVLGIIRIKRHYEIIFFFCERWGVIQEQFKGGKGRREMREPPVKNRMKPVWRWRAIENCLNLKVKADDTPLETAVMPLFQVQTFLCWNKSAYGQALYPI